MAARTAAQRANRRATKENDVERAICDFLRARRWRVQRNQSGLFQRPHGNPNSRIRIGEKGMYDWEAVRAVGNGGDGPALVQFFYLETKRPGGKLSADQKAWGEMIRREGFVAYVADSLERFETWYFERYPTERRPKL